MELLNITVDRQCIHMLGFCNHSLSTHVCLWRLYGFVPKGFWFRKPSVFSNSLLDNSKLIDNFPVPDPYLLRDPTCLSITWTVHWFNSELCIASFLMWCCRSIADLLVGSLKLTADHCDQLNAAGSFKQKGIRSTQFIISTC